jgi:hypothetical protein
MPQELLKSPPFITEQQCLPFVTLMILRCVCFLFFTAKFSQVVICWKEAGEFDV